MCPDMSGGKADVWQGMLEKLNIQLPKESRDLVGKPLLKAVFQQWLNAAEALKCRGSVERRRGDCEQARHTLFVARDFLCP